MGKLEDTYTNIGPNELKMTSPKQGSLCAAKFSEDGAWYRAKIVKVVDRANVEVQYIDYGNCEVAALNDLKELKGEFLQDAAYALHCSLAGVGNWFTYCNTLALKHVQCSIDIVDAFRIEFFRMFGVTVALKAVSGVLTTGKNVCGKNLCQLFVRAP